MKNAIFLDGVLCRMKGLTQRRCEFSVKELNKTCIWSKIDIKYRKTEGEGETE